MVITEKYWNNKDINAVFIATPDHWHCKIMVDACMAGKDVYCEKPVGNSIAECAAMVAAQKKYNSVVQVGQWQHSNKHYRMQWILCIQENWGMCVL